MSCTPCEIVFENSEDWEAHVKLCSKELIEGDIKNKEDLVIECRPPIEQVDKFLW